MLNLLFYLGCLLVLLKGGELLVAAMKEPAGTNAKRLGYLLGGLGIVGAVLLVLAGDRIADLERTDTNEDIQRG